MRNFLTSRAFAVMILVFLLCVGSVLYTGASGGSNPLSGALHVAVTPLQKGVSWLTGTFSHGISYFSDYDRLVAENERLNKELREAEQKLRDAQIALDENARLRSLAGIKERNRSFEFEVAEVIARSIGDWQSTLTLDKGTMHEIEEGDMVITDDGMVGYVAVSAPNYCEVTTIIDTEMQAGALITRTREVAIAEGDYTLLDEGALRLSYLAQDADIVIGDTVETSGRGGLFPKGIMIGRIEQILPEEHGMSNYAIVRPFVDVRSVSHVFIIKSFEVTE
ncbi:MAG: rod shape-determining protein MreC [Clostridiaceae bacterium]|nr:rod shape-determining protein MreC [Clostridiaceae bacterium]